VSSSNQLEYELENCLKSVAEQRGEHFATRLRSILIANLGRGRIHYYLNSHAGGQLHEYVERVAKCYERLGPYIDKAQKTKEQDVWESLFETLLAWASRILRRAGAHPDDLDQLAREYATAAAGRILTAHFPYDTEFEPWAYVLVRNVCREYRRRENRNLDSIDNEQIARLPDPAQTDREQPHRLRLELLDAVQHLSSDARRHFIMLYYFQGYALSEIAQILNRSLSAIYKLHFDTLNELRKIWSGKEHKDE